MIQRTNRCMSNTRFSVVVSLIFLAVCHHDVKGLCLPKTGLPPKSVKSIHSNNNDISARREYSRFSLTTSINAKNQWRGRSKLNMIGIETSSEFSSLMMDHSDTYSSLQSASTSLLLSFSDQGSNLAGLFFQASLLPYLLFLYFLSFRANRISPLANFGFQFVLLFVLSTIPSGIISRSNYGYSLADTDWLHGGAETLLTVANILIVLGFQQAITNPAPSKNLLEKSRLAALSIAGLFGLCCVVGPQFLSDGHSAFLGGIGNLPQNWVEQQLPWVSHSEPLNALSIPTWAIHFSSVFEYLFAMNLVWRFSETTQNESWKGLTWGMLPLHASGICACTYHFFYNQAALQFLVTTQAGLTLLGNITCMIAAYRIAVSNGWTIQDEFRLLPFVPRSPTSPTGLIADGLAAMPLKTTPDSVESPKALAAKLVGLTIFTSYAVKYGELGISLPFTPNSPVAVAMIVGIPGLVAFQYYQKSKQGSNESNGQMIPSFNLPWGNNNDEKPTFTMDDVKKYGVAGTVAYVLTELAFWVVAFPVAATALYQSTGHWPDLVNDNTDRAAVLAFIFAGANIARAFVPIRFGAALALAPWVDENIISRIGNKSNPNPE